MRARAGSGKSRRGAQIGQNHTRFGGQTRGRVRRREVTRGRARSGRSREVAGIWVRGVRTAVWLPLDSVGVARDHSEIRPLVIQCVAIFVVDFLTPGRLQLTAGLLAVGHLASMPALRRGSTLLEGP